MALWPPPPLLLCGGGTRWLWSGAWVPALLSATSRSWLPASLLAGVVVPLRPSTKKTWPSVVKSVRTKGMQGRGAAAAAAAAPAAANDDDGGEPARGQKTEDWRWW